MSVLYTDEKGRTVSVGSGDLFGERLRREQEYRNWQEDTLLRLNRENGVIEDIEDLRGWHLVEAELRKPGVYRIVTSRYTREGAEMRHGFASQKIITTARELGYLSAPNGFTLPNVPDEP